MSVTTGRLKASIGIEFVAAVAWHYGFGVLFGEALVRLMDCAFNNIRGASVHQAVTP